jgi:Carboxypeptidase regulatory-like domain
MLRWTKLPLVVLFLHVSGAIISAQTVSQRQVPPDFSYPEASITVVIQKPFFAKSLSGIVYVQTPDGLPDVLVECVTPDGSRRLDAVFTDSEGRFSFPVLLRGTYHLRLSKPGFSALRVRVVLSGKSRRQLRLNLPLGI